MSGIDIPALTDRGLDALWAIVRREFPHATTGALSFGMEIRLHLVAEQRAADKGLAVSGDSILDDLFHGCGLDAGLMVCEPLAPVLTRVGRRFATTLR